MSRHNHHLTEFYMQVNYSNEIMKTPKLFVVQKKNFHIELCMHFITGICHY